jgi:hypothetical protein
MSHTPGPWHTSPCSHGGLIVIRDGISQSHIQIVPEEDARLIAAAPALADALRDLLAYLESPALHDAAVAIPRARAALALADGSKP